MYDNETCDVIRNNATCKDAIAYMDAFLHAESNDERMARFDAFCEHATLCTTCNNDGLVAIESND